MKWQEKLKEKISVCRCIMCGVKHKKIHVKDLDLVFKQAEKEAHEYAKKASIITRTFDFFNDQKMVFSELRKILKEAKK